jgi:hypothetical protein
MNKSICAGDVNVEIEVIPFRMPQPAKLEEDFFQLGGHSTTANPVLKCCGGMHMSKSVHLKAQHSTQVHTRVHKSTQDYTVYQSTQLKLPFLQ